MRNPFRIRASQRSVSDEQFVRLFGAGALDVLDELADPWGGLVFLRSAPGGGKTSFLRLLTPRPLKIAAGLYNEAEARPTYDALRNRGAIGPAGPELLGVMVSFTTEYRDLEEIDRAAGMFRALLNARIVVATIRAILERSERSYPDDLETLRAAWRPESTATIPAAADGRQLFEWASEIERRFYDRLDELGDAGAQVEGHARLDALTWFAEARFEDAHGEIDARRVLLMDDLQCLSANQHRTLTDLLVGARKSCGVWVAERLEALSHQEILGEGALRQRDYEGVIQLENNWTKRGKAYSKLVGEIAELRARRADGFEDKDFFALLAEEDDIATWGNSFEQICDTIEERLVRRVGHQERYARWLEQARASESPPLKRATNWRATEILIERDLSRTQSAFDFEVLTEQDFAGKGSSGVWKAAEHLLRREVGAPLYFGRETLAAASSTNIDQYVEVAGDIFEELSAKLSGPRSAPPSLSADRQDAIIRRGARTRWTDVARRLPKGYAARRLLEAAGVFCQQQTNRPTAPYAPGVTGFAIPMSERGRLIDTTGSDALRFAELRDVLTSLVAHNLLAPRLDHRNKGREFVVFYLNRLICVEFELPLGYGGWREKSLKDLARWTELGKQAVKTDRLV